MRSKEEREVVTVETLSAPPAEMQEDLRAVVRNLRGYGWLGTDELGRLIERGLDPFRHYCDDRDYGESPSPQVREQRSNLLLLLLRAQGGVTCLSWLMQRYDLSECWFTGSLGSRIAATMLKHQPSAMLVKLVEAGLRGADVLQTLQGSIDGAYMKSWDPYANALTNSPLLSFIDAMRRTGQLNRHGEVFQRLLLSQRSLTMVVVRNFEQACGGIAATDFSPEASRVLIAEMLTKVEARDQALEQLRAWGFDRYPVSEAKHARYSWAYIYANAGQLGAPVLEFLLSAQFHVDEPTESGDTALMMAVRGNDLPAVRWLVEHGARVDVRNKQGSSLMHEAVLRGSLPLIDYLFACGAPTGLRNEDGRTPAGLSGNNNSDYLNLLLGRSIPKGRNLAMLAVEDGCDDKLEEAIAADDDVNALDDEGRGIANCISARSKANPRIWELLGRAGFDFEAQSTVMIVRVGKETTKCKVPLLHKVCRDAIARTESDLAVVRYMVRAGADVNVLDPEGYTPLHRAIKSENRELVKLLLEEGADHTIKLGRTSTLQMSRDEEIKRLLMAYRLGHSITSGMSGAEEVRDAPAIGSSDVMPL